MKIQTKEQWLEERKSYIGASDAASVINCGKWGCALSLFNTKTGVAPDYDNSDRAEFRRGKRLEGIVANYYEAETGRRVYFTQRQHVPGKNHLAVSMDRIVYKKEDEKEKNPGYLEIKVLGRWSMNAVKKDGLPEDYIVQTQYGMAVTGVKWGSFAIYSPETDELLHWDFEADRTLGEALLEKADDFFSLNISCGIAPDRLVEGARQCETCVYKFSCWAGVDVKPALDGINTRDDLEGLVAALAEARGMNSESEQAAEGLRDEIMAALNMQPGKYRAGKFEFEFKIAKQKRFKGELLKARDPKLYEELRVESETKTITKPKEV